MEGSQMTFQCNVAALVGMLLCANCGADSAQHQGPDSSGAGPIASADVAGAKAPPRAMSPYANQPASPIRGLSAQEYDDLQNGRGMGLARAAELNGYPGPRHVLDLSAQLQLGAGVATEIESLYMTMDTDARRLGAEILANEQVLNQAFERGSATDEQVAALLENLGALYGQLRGVHMRAHVAVRQLLTPAQILIYNQVRGYAMSNAHAAHHGS